MRNKKSKILAAVAALLMTAPLAAAANAPTAVAEDYSVLGGRVTIDFEDEADIVNFDRYSEFGHLPYITDGVIYGWVFAEQKMIYNGAIFSDVQVDVDISTIGAGGKFDSGVYIGASNPGDAMDAITAWEVNIEHGPGSSTFWLKLHRFENNRWIREEMVEISGLNYIKDTMHLRVAVKSGNLYAFLDGSETPTVTKYIGAEARGRVGLRNFYAPCYFDNFTIVGPALDVDFDDMLALKAIAEARVKENVVAECKTELNAAIALAEAAEKQTEADEATAALKAALDRAELAHTLDELKALVVEAEKITNAGNVYTGNSYAAFDAVREICSTLTADDGEYEISYWYARLEEKTENLIAYSKESA